MRGWMIAAVSTLVASGAWAGLRVGTERAPEPKVVPIVVEGGHGDSEPIDAEGYTEFAIYKSHYESRFRILCAPLPGLEGLHIYNTYRKWTIGPPGGDSGISGYFQTSHDGGGTSGGPFKDLRCPWLTIEQYHWGNGDFPDTLGYIYLR